MPNKIYRVTVDMEFMSEDAAGAIGLTQKMIKAGFYQTDDPRRNAQFIEVKAIRAVDVEEEAAREHARAMNGG